MLIVDAPKSTPIVGPAFAAKRWSVNCSSRHDLPTDMLPTMMNRITYFAGPVARFTTVARGSWDSWGLTECASYAGGTAIGTAIGTGVDGTGVGTSAVTSAGAVMGEETTGDTWLTTGFTVARK